MIFQNISETNNIQSKTGIIKNDTCFGFKNNQISLKGYFKCGLIIFKIL